jgi:ribosomal protein S8
MNPTTLSKTSCAKCKKTITDRCFLHCSNCKDDYCLQCANAEKRFFNTMSPERKSKWACVPCKVKQSKGNTVFGRQNLPLTKTNVNNKKTDRDLIITTRSQQKLANMPMANDDNDDSIVSQLGNTMCTPNDIRDNVNICTIDQISHLLDTKLEQYKTLIISELKSEMRSLIQHEIHDITSNLKVEIKENMTCLTSKQNALTYEIDQLHSKIATMENEQKKLKNEIQNLQNGHNMISQKPTEDTCKKIVLYGLNESRRENEDELYRKISYVFRDILNVNLEGYIEDLHRLGKRGNRRPIVIELISKRMTKFILDNYRRFKETGLVISRYLDGEGINTRRELIVLLQEARNQGKNAVIRNNKLLINGKEHSQPEHTYLNTNEDQKQYEKHAEAITRTENKNQQCLIYTEQPSQQDTFTSTPNTHQQLDLVPATPTGRVNANFRPYT